jgi:hypothetical protein
VPISAQRWRRIEPILDGALDLEAEHRAAYLVQACGGDEALRAEVEALLRSCDRAQHFLEGSAEAFARPLLASAGCDPLSSAAS